MSLGEPFLLSRHSVPSSWKHEDSVGCYASHSSTSTKSEGVVTLTVQADGLHLQDASSLHPVASHVIGPEASFACPAVTVARTDGEGLKAYTTYAGMGSSPNLAEEGQGRTIWKWTDRISGKLEKSQPPQSLQLPHEIVALIASHHQSPHIYALSSELDLSIVSDDLVILHTHSLASPSENHVLLKSFHFPRRSCTFAPVGDGDDEGTILLLLVAAGKKLVLKAVAIDLEGGAVEVCSLPVPGVDVKDSKRTFKFSCSASGILSVLVDTGAWHSYRLTPSTNTIDLSQLNETTALHNLLLSSPRTLSLLSLGSSHTLLAGLSSDSTELVFLLWDLRYSVVLALHKMALPSSLPPPAEGNLDLALVGASLTQCALVLTPRLAKSSTKASGTKYRSAVLLLPFTVPVASTIATALGRAKATEPWLSSSSSATTKSQSGKDRQIFGEKTTKMLESVRSALAQERVEAAGSTFRSWVVAETKADGTPPALPDALVRRLLEIALPEKGEVVEEVVAYLLERRVVRSGMVEGGVLRASHAKKDWALIKSTLVRVFDLPEGDVLALLREVADHHRKTDEDAMQVDSVAVASTSDIPPLPEFLALCVSMPSSPAPLRVAMRDHLKPVENVVAVLQVLEEWIEASTVEGNENKLIRGEETSGESQFRPSLSKILTFTQCLLDSSLLALLQYAPCHALLRSLAAALDPQISAIDDIARLRGPLEPFVRAQTKAERDAAAGKTNKPQINGRKRRAKIRDETSLAVGLYRVEELVI